jgi:hypothetical protein
VKEVELLQSAGIAVAIVAHGSEIRIPSQHADLYAHSPFKNVPSDMAEWVARLEKQAIRNVELARDLGVSMFVPTYDLFDFVPSAILNPNTIDVTQWTSDEPVLARDRPVVVFAPTKGWLKGSQYIDPVLQSLADEGLIDYRRIVGLPSAQVMSIIKEADVVIDSAGLGYYATTTVQAMAAGRLTIVHLDERVKGRLPGEFPGIALDDPTTLENTLREVLANRDVYRAVAAKAPAFASETHDGRVSSAALSTVWNA